MTDKTKLIQEEENARKRQGLFYSERLLICGNRHLTFQLLDNGNKVLMIDKESGWERKINVAGDNVQAMVFDIFRQGWLWII